MVPSTTVSTVSPGTGTRPVAVEVEPLITVTIMLAVVPPVTATTWYISVQLSACDSAIADWNPRVPGLGRVTSGRPTGSGLIACFTG